MDPGPSDELAEINKRFDQYFDKYNKEKQQDEEVLEAMQKTSNLDGLDLEISQSQMKVNEVLRQGAGQAKDEKFKGKNDLLESLDLQVGIDALMSLQN